MRLYGPRVCLHVPNIEQARLLTCPVMRLDDAQVAVLDGHVVAAKRDKPGAVLAVQLIQPCPFDRRLLSCR